MKKIATAVLAALACAGFAFADVKLSFENKVYEDDAVWAKFGKNETAIPYLPADKTDTDFPAIKNSMKVELESDQVDAMVKGIWYLDDDEYSEHYYVDGFIDDWYIEFRPVEILTLALHDNIYSEGSYLPIYDDNLQGGNIGSDGFTVVVRPNAFNKALRIAATIPWGDWGNYINGKEEDYEDENFHVGAGFIFSLPQIELGATFQQPNCSDHRLIGASVSFPTLFGIHEGLKLSAGFTNDKAGEAGIDDLIYEEYGGVVGENIINAAVSFEQDALTLAAEVLYALDQEEPSFGSGDYIRGECYAAVSCGYGVNEKLTLGVTGKILTYKSTDDVTFSPMWSAGINADYDLDEHNSFGAGFEFISWGGFDSDTYGKYNGVNGFKVPVYWKWAL